jgi:hypothetical protein
MFVIDACGPVYARRYFLTDGDGNHWSEKGWTPNLRKATLFANANDAGQKMHELMQTLPGQLHRFIRPLKNGENGRVCLAQLAVA